MKRFKFDSFQAGQVIKAQDFRSQGDASYIQGTVLEVHIDPTDLFSFPHYVIRPTVCFLDGAARRIDEGALCYVPMEVWRDWDDRVQLIMEA